MDLSKPFRGAEAVAAGATTRRRLAGASFRAIGPDVHVAVDAPDDLTTRVRAALVGVPGAVIGGYAAAELFGVSCGPADAPIELVVGRRRVRARLGVAIRQDVLADQEVLTVDGLPVTTPLRIAYDLARVPDHAAAVVAVDALAHRFGFDLQELLRYPASRANPRGAARIPGVVEDADPRSESPMETRTRLVLVVGGIPQPVLQYWALDRSGRALGRLDMAWPRLRVGVEYQGDQHRVDRVRYARDTARSARLAVAGWLILPATADDVLRSVDGFVERVRQALELRAGALDSRSFS